MEHLKGLKRVENEPKKHFFAKCSMFILLELNGRFLFVWLLVIVAAVKDLIIPYGHSYFLDD